MIPQIGSRPHGKVPNALVTMMPRRFCFARLVLSILEAAARLRELSVMACCNARMRGSAGIAAVSVPRDVLRVALAGRRSTPPRESNYSDVVDEEDSHLVHYGISMHIFYLACHCQQNMFSSLPRGIPTVVDESVEVRVREPNGVTEHKRQRLDRFRPSA